MFLVKPKTPDTVLIGPDGRRVPDAGVMVPELTLFWRRRAADEDAVVTDAPAEAETAPEPKKKG